MEPYYAFYYWKCKRYPNTSVSLFMSTGFCKEYAIFNIRTHYCKNTLYSIFYLNILTLIRESYVVKGMLYLSGAQNTSSKYAIR